MTDSSGCKLSELLPTDLGEVTQTLREELGKNIERPEPGLLPFLGAQAADALGGILDVDVFEVLARGWVTARELQELADDERYPPDKTVTVTLGKHEFTTSVHPTLTFEFAGLPARTLVFTCELKAEIKSVRLQVRARRLRALGAGEGTVSAQLKYGAVKLHREMKSRAVPLSGWLSLRGEGFEIVRARDD